MENAHGAFGWRPSATGQSYTVIFVDENDIERVIISSSLTSYIANALANALNANLVVSEAVT